MNQSIQQPKLSLIIKSDYTCSLGFIGIIVSIGFVIFSKFYKNDNILATIFLSLILLCSILLIIRISNIRNIFKFGSITTGKVINVIPVRGKHQIYFSYKYNDKEYEKMNVVEVNKKTENIKEGDSIDICVYSKYPKKALIYSIYVD